MKKGDKVKFEIAKHEWEELSIDNQLKLQDLMSEYFGVDIQGLIEGVDGIQADESFINYLEECECCDCCGSVCEEHEASYDGDFDFLYPDEDE